MIMSLFQDICYNKSFSQLAKESTFTFNLYRGRVDWKKLEELDVDRVVRDQDVELLNLYTSSITNCSLEFEYDVKILDPNFIKLFRLAQLLIDFLLHCKKYLEHCIKVAHESLQTSNREIEILRKQLQARKTEVKQLKKKFKEVTQQLVCSPGVAGPTFECSLCGKVFMSETFLHGHHARRHQPLPYSLVLRPFNTTPASPHIKIGAQQTEEKTKNIEEISSIKKKYQEEIEDLKKLFFAEIAKLKQNENNYNQKIDIQTQSSKEEKEEYKSVQNELKLHEATSKKGPQIILKETESSSTGAGTKSSKVTTDQTVDQEEGQNIQQTEEIEERNTINGLKTDSGNSIQTKGGGEEEWVKRLEEREAVWRERLSTLDLQHKRQVQQLQDKLNSTQLQGQEMKKDLELRLEEVLAKFEQSQQLLESQKQESVQEDDNKKVLAAKTDIIVEKSGKPKQKIMSTEGILHRQSPKRPPPFQKRRAFVSQKTKTIQDSFEITESKETPENLVQVLNPEDDSDLENVSTLTQNSSKEKIDQTALAEKKTTPITNFKTEPNEILGRNKNKESIIARLLEEERLRSLSEKNKGSDNQEVVVEEDSTFSESVTETESESVQEDGGEGRRESQSAEDQLLREESDLAQQSLQSMEALLAANPGILQQLRSDLEDLVGRRLQNLGVDPTWRGLPPVTYRDRMAALTHQRNITAKSHPVYFTLRDKLRGDAESAVATRSKAQPRSSPADNLLSRLRSKAAQVINAARFTRRLGSQKRQSSSPHVSDLKPLAASSPQLTNEPEDNFSSNQSRNTTGITQVQSAAGGSFSLSSSTDEGDEEDKRDEVVAARGSIVSPQTQASYKSALRNAVSTSSLAKKKVLFVDEAFADPKRSKSENVVNARENINTASRPSENVSVASLVQEIQQQLTNRSEKPSFSIDLMKQPDSLVKQSEIPLSQILPLTKSGRDLLETQPKSSPKRVQTIQEPLKVPDLKSPRALEPLSHILQRVPTSKPSSSTFSLGKKPDLLDWSARSQLQPPKLSPAPSLSSIGSSLLDLSASPRPLRQPLRGSLEWDLQDLLLALFVFHWLTDDEITDVSQCQ